MSATRRRVTARDVAKAAGVSQSTVSYVLNDTPNQTIPAATRDKVLGAVEELGYVPSAAARVLRTGMNPMIMVAIPQAPRGANFARLMEVISDTLEPQGYSVLFRRERGDHATVKACKELRPAALIDQIILPDEDVAAVRAAGIPVLRTRIDTTDPGEISVPGALAGRLQAAHLLTHGHSRFGFAAPVESYEQEFGGVRLSGVAEVLEAAGKPAPVVVSCPLDAVQAAASVSQWVRATDRVTAVCAYNDEQALAILAGMRILGLRAPDDLAVIGVDNYMLGAFSDPPLSSVDLLIDDLSRAAADAVVALVNGQELPLLEARAEVVERASC